MSGEDAKFMAFVRTLPCCAVPCIDPCGPPHHSTNGSMVAPGAEPRGKQLGGRRGRGQTAHDHHAISLCIKHHRQFHDKKGHFAGWTDQERRDWQDRMVRETLALYDKRQPAVSATGKSDKRKRARPGAGWSVAGVLDLLRKEARHRTGEVSAAFSELADLIERDTV